MSAPTHPKEIVNDRKAPNFTDAELVQIGDMFLKEQMLLQPTCRVTGKKDCFWECSCLSLFKDLELRKANAKYMVKFAKMHKREQQTLMIGWIREAKQRQKSVRKDKLCYKLPAGNSDTPICVNALLTVLGYGKTFYATCHACVLQNKEAPEHGLKGNSNKEKVFDEEVGDDLRDFLTEVCDDAELVVDDGGREVLELGSSFSKLGLYRKFCFDRGWKVTFANGNATAEKRSDFDGEAAKVCSFSTFKKFWKANFAELKVQQPGKPGYVVKNKKRERVDMSHLDCRPPKLTKDGRTIAHPKEITNDRKRLKLFDDEQLTELGVMYLKEQARLQPTCKQRYHICSCLQLFRENEDDDDSLAFSVARSMVEFAKKSKQEQQLTVIDWINRSKLVNAAKHDKCIFLLPTASDNGDRLICRKALLTIIGYGQVFYDRCEKHANEGTIPEHGLTGRKSNRAVSHEKEVPVDALHTFLKDVCSQAKRITDESGNETLQLGASSSLSQRSLFRQFCYDRGWEVSITENGVVTKEERVDWNGDTLPICSFLTFKNFWKEHYPQLRTYQAGKMEEWIKAKIDKKTSCGVTSDSPKKRKSSKQTSARRSVKKTRRLPTKNSHSDAAAVAAPVPAHATFTTQERNSPLHLPIDNPGFFGAWQNFVAPQQDRAPPPQPQYMLPETILPPATLDWHHEQQPAFTNTTTLTNTDRGVNLNTLANVADLWPGAAGFTQNYQQQPNNNRFPFGDIQRWL